MTKVSAVLDCALLGMTQNLKLMGYCLTPKHRCGSLYGSHAACELEMMKASQSLLLLLQQPDDRAMLQEQCQNNGGSQPILQSTAETTTFHPKEMTTKEKSRVAL